MTDSQKPAIRFRASERDDLLIFEVVDKITRSDIEAMATRVEAAFDRFDQIDILILMSDFEGADLAAVFDRRALGVELKSIRKVRRYAVVGAPVWLAAMVELGDVFSPVESKAFSMEDLPVARAWIDGDA